MEGKTCILLMNMGGPGSLDDVEPFLYNLFMDPDIIDIPLGRLLRPFIAGKISKKRAEKVRGYYKKIGGKSPLLDLTLEQASELEKSLKGGGEYRVFVAMRYWQPFTEEAIAGILKERPSRILLLPLYPQFSSTTTGSSLNEFYRIWKQKGDSETEILEIRDWHNHPGYIGSWVETIRAELDSCGGNRPYIIFSAHGIPRKLVDGGDPYQAQTEETVSLIVEALKWEGEWQIAYQSRVGPVRWLEPATETLLKELGEKGTENVLMVPISFVSDHSETLYEMDIQYKTLAGESGIRNFRRAPSLNSRKSFIEALGEIVAEKLETG